MSDSLRQQPALLTISRGECVCAAVFRCVEMSVDYINSDRLGSVKLEITATEPARRFCEKLSVDFKRLEACGGRTDYGH